MKFRLHVNTLLRYDLIAVFYKHIQLQYNFTILDGNTSIY